MLWIHHGTFTVIYRAQYFFLLLLLKLVCEFYNHTIIVYFRYLPCFRDASEIILPSYIEWKVAD